MKRGITAVLLLSLLNDVVSFSASSLRFRSGMNTAFDVVKHNFIAIAVTLAMVFLTSLFFNKDENMELLKACAEPGGEGVARVKALLDSDGVNINFRRRANKTTPLVCAVAFGRVEVVRLLLARGALVDLQDEQRGTPLMVACAQGDMACVGALLEAGASVDAKRTKDFASALHLASMGGHEDICTELVKKGCDVGWRNAAGFTAVSLVIEAITSRMHSSVRGDASRCGASGVKVETSTDIDAYLAILQLLSRAGADINAANARGWTPLMVAARWNARRAVETLLALKCDIDRASPSGLTALMAACAGPHPNVVSLLLASGASVALRGTDATTSPLYAAVNAGSIAAAVATAKAMQQPPSPIPRPPSPASTSDNTGRGEGSVHATLPDCQDDEAQTLETNQTTTVDLLLKYGARSYVNHRYKAGSTVLMVAANGGHTGSVELLLKAGADVHAVRDDGWTALIAAAEGGCRDVVAALLAHKADANRCTGGNEMQTNVGAKSRHWSALHAATAQGNTDVVELLLKAGARPTGMPTGVSADDGAALGPTPLHIAAYEGHVAIARVLLDAGASVDGCDPKGNTALCAAVRGSAVPSRRLKDGVGVETDESVQQGLADSLVLIQLLIDRGADLGVTNTDGFNPAAIAAIVGVTPVLKLLLEAPEAVPPTGSLTWALRFFVARIRATCSPRTRLTSAHHAAQ